jgi:hypothetical protein
VKVDGNFIDQTRTLRTGEVLKLPDNHLVRVTLEYLVMEDADLEKRSGFMSAFDYRDRLLNCLCEQNYS